MSFKLFVIGLLVGLSIANAEKVCKCTPNLPCWPSPFVWSVLNFTLGGRLQRLSPAASVCYTNSERYNSIACEEVRENYANTSWREAHPNTVLAINNEFLRNLTCPLPSDNSSICYQGGVSIYGINASTVAHVQEAILFAKLYNLRVVIKSTGHDFLGRSSAPGSLLIWTRYMKSMTFSSQFLPLGGNHDAGPAITVQTGTMWEEVYPFAEIHGYNIVGGAGPTVSAAGGYGTGGGHGPLSPKYGLAVDNVLQYEVVTAQGLHLVVSEFSYHNLFWALRGGGGSAFVVVISVTYKVHPPTPLTVGRYALLSNNKTSWISAMAYLAAQQPVLSDQGWAGYYYPSQKQVSMAFWATNTTLTEFEATIAPFQALVSTLPGLTLVGLAESFSNFSYAYSQLAQPLQADAMVSYGYYGSRLIPRSVHLDNPQGIAEALWNSGVVSICAIAGGEVNKKDPDSVAANPAWRKAVWHTLTSAVWTATTPYEEQLVIRANNTARVQYLRDLAPNSGAYFNEMDHDEPNWQKAAFGDHYSRLYRIKKLWDPTDLFLCHHCVGSEEWNLDTNCKND